MKKSFQTVDLTNKVKERLMSLSEIETQNELNQELDALDAQVAYEQKQDRQKAVISWVTSLSIHAVVLLIAMSVAFTVVEQEMECPPIRVSTIAPPPVKRPDDIKIDRDIIERIVLIESEEKTTDEKNPVVHLDIPDDITSSEDDTTTPTDIKKGREEAVSDMEMGGLSFVGNIGAGGPASGMFGSRTGGGHNRAKVKMGDQGKPADAASDAGLRWLKKHQSPNGMWSATKYFQNCTDGLKCEPGAEMSGDEDVAMTGYAVLCFLGQGFDHKTPNKYRPVVQKGIEYLLSVQKPEGLMGDRNYEHPVAAMALVEAYGLSNDPAIRESAQKAVNFILTRQSKLKDDEYSRLGWDYVAPNAKRNDISVSGWNIMALKSAFGAGLNVGEGINGSKKLLEGAWKSANKDWAKLTNPYTDKSVFPYTWNADADTTERDHLSFVGATCAVFLGHKSGDIMLETLLNDAENRWIKSGAYKKNNYACYYLSLAQFQAGGDRWKLCLETLIPNSIETQRKTQDCLNGSWDYQDQSWHGKDTGRVLSTCYNILNLQVAYRYAQVNGGMDKILKKK
jgi:hypothetical protein